MGNVSASPLATFSDRDLIAELHRLAHHERTATVNVIAALMELDARRLYLGEGCSSLFTYCTQVLHFSEHAAYGRIEAARVARRFPCIIDLLADGSVTLTAIGLLAAHLTLENHEALLATARHKSKRDVERIVATLRPLPAVPSSVRKVPMPTAVPDTSHAEDAVVPAASVLFGPTGSGNASCRPVPPHGPVESTNPSAPLQVANPRAAAKPAIVAPLAPDRYKVQVTISRQAHDHLRRAQDLLRHVVPNGDPAAIVERALSLLVEDLERRKLAATKRPRSKVARVAHGRHVPAAVKREVWARDGGQCAFVGATGRCTERGLLEFHHVVPFADGGATDAANLQLRCRAHNAYEAEAWFGSPIVRERPAIGSWSRLGNGGDSVRTECRGGSTYPGRW
jgi:hypothetical protein